LVASFCSPLSRDLFGTADMPLISKLARRLLCPSHKKPIAL
jgi:hypothetical protein